MCPLGLQNLTDRQGAQCSLMVESRAQLNSHHVNESMCVEYNIITCRVAEVFALRVEYLMDLICYHEA